MDSLKLFFNTMLAGFMGIMAVPVAKPAAEVVGAQFAAYSAQLPAPVKVEAAAPNTEVEVTAEVTAPIPQAQPAPEPQPVASIARCCHECTCEVCTCEYPGQCLLKAAGKHILWIHDEKTGAWRGYASPHCKDVRELAKARAVKVQQGGACSGGSCRVR